MDVHGYGTRMGMAMNMDWMVSFWAEMMGEGRRGEGEYITLIGGPTLSTDAP